MCSIDLPRDRLYAEELITKIGVTVENFKAGIDKTSLQRTCIEIRAMFIDKVPYSHVLDGIPEIRYLEIHDWPAVRPNGFSNFF